MASASHAGARIRGEDGEAENHPLNLMVRFSTDKSYCVNVNMQDRVQNIKEKVAQKTDTSANNINLVIAGQLMESEKLVQVIIRIFRCVCSFTFVLITTNKYMKNAFPKPSISLLQIAL